MASLLVRLEDRVVAALLVHELGLGDAPRLARRYRVLGIRGRGARGLVCRAIDERLEREVAIKMYADVDSTRDDEVDTEARALARLDHPNVVRVYDVGRDELVVASEPFVVSYLVMELVDGLSLRTYLATMDRSHEATLRILADVATALEAAHARGLAHRDMKPENVMIDAAGRVRVVDFGLSRYSNTDPDATILDDELAPFATAQGKLVGTVEYMAPEARTGVADSRSDQFSFAMMAWEALTGVLPFDGRAGHWRPDDASRFEGHAEVDPALRPVLERALSVDPAERHRSMAPLREAFLPDRFGTKLSIAAGVAVVAMIALAFGLSRAASPPREPPREDDAGSAAALAPVDASSGAATRPIVDAGTSADCGFAAGRWEVDAVVVTTRLRSVPAGTHSYFVMDVQPLAGCDALVRLTKVGDEAAATDAGAFFAVDDIRDDDARVQLRRVGDAAEFEQRFGLASPKRARREYDVAVRFGRRRLVGDIAYLSATGAVSYRAEIRGFRRRSESPLVAAPSSLPCGSRCRLTCGEEAAVVANCIETCGRGAIPAACEFDAGVSRSTLPTGQPE